MTRRRNGGREGWRDGRKKEREEGKALLTPRATISRCLLLTRSASQVRKQDEQKSVTAHARKTE